MLERFAYPGLARAAGVGLALFLVGVMLVELDVSRAGGLTLRFLGLIVAFFAVAWYLFNWFVDDGIRRLE